MSTTARMYVQKICQTAWNPGAKVVELQVVSRGPENAKWAAATPTGGATLTINNPEAAELFEVGKEYLVTFDLAPDPAEPPLQQPYDTSR